MYNSAKSKSANNSCHLSRLKPNVNSVSPHSFTV